MRRSTPWWSLVLGVLLLSSWDLGCTQTRSSDDDDDDDDDDSWLNDDDASDDDGADDDASDDDGADDDASDDDGADDDTEPADDDGADDDGADDDGADDDTGTDGYPVAVCSVTPVEANVGATLTWNGSGSYDTAERPITNYSWTISSFPSGSHATISGSGANRTTVTDVSGEYSARLVVTNDLGQTSAACTAFADVVSPNGLEINLTWAYSGDDMDLHLLKEGGTVETSGDCYYANCATGTLDWGVVGYDGDDPLLEEDDIEGTGPEIISIEDPADGVYTIVVNDYPGSVYDEPNTATVKVYIGGSLRATLLGPMEGGEDEYWYAATVSFPSGTVTAL